MPGNKIVLGTRGSELARAQTRLVEEALRAAAPEFEVEIRVIETRGDKSGATFQVAHAERAQVENMRHASGRKGIFTREIEDALRRREIDAAVHSAKDLPSNSPPDLEICATLPRAAVDDILLIKNAASLTSLPAQATVATGSVRRKHQLQWKRPDLRILDLRGNVPTRLRKFIENDWDAMVLARAGLERLGHDLSQNILNFEGQALNLEHLSQDEFLPAGGQGVIAIQVRRDDPSATEWVQAIDHPPTLLCLRAEREFLRLLQVDCNAPVGVLATIASQVMTLRAQIFEEKEGETRGEVKTSLQEQEPEAVAAALYAMMYGQA
jgi:hydroxymethylbilane synthase